MSEEVSFRWLGAAGVELEIEGQRLLADPYLSRFPLRNIFFGRPNPRREQILRHLLPARAVLVTHSHFDHLMDVPVVCRELGATAFGSPNTSAILLALGVPPEKIRTVFPGGRFAEGPFSVEVFRAKHGPIAGIVPYVGAIPKRLHPPLRLSEYRMDFIYSYRISAGGVSFLLWNTPDSAEAPESDVLAIVPSRSASTWSDLVAKVRPKVIIPIHWDDFFCGLDRPLRPMWAPPRLGARLFQRMDPAVFARALQALFPESKVVVPVIFTSMEFGSSS